jgi:hypothetical protein
MMLLYITKYQVISIIILFLLFILNIGYYLIKNRSNSIITIINTFLVRNVLLLVLLFYYMHWLFQDVLSHVLLASALVVMVISTIIAINKKSMSPFLRLDNLLNYLIIIYFVSIYII